MSRPRSPAIAAAMAAEAQTIHASAAASASTIAPEAQERLRALGYVASSTAPAPPSGAPNPATTIAAWNEFEEALGALNAHQPNAVTRLRALATAHADAPVFQATYARALKESGQLTAALAVYRQSPRGAGRRMRSLLHDLAVAAREAANAAPGGMPPGRCASRRQRADEAALALDADERHGAQRARAARRRQRPRRRGREGVRARDRDRSEQRHLLDEPRQRARARSAIGPAPSRPTARRSSSTRTLPMPPTASASCWSKRSGRLTRQSWFERAIAAAPDFVEARLNLGIALQESGQSARAADAYRQVLAAPAKYKRERDAAAKLLASLEGAR